MNDGRQDEMEAKAAEPEASSGADGFPDLVPGRRRGPILFLAVAITTMTI